MRVEDYEMPTSLGPPSITTMEATDDSVLDSGRVRYNDRPCRRFRTADPKRQRDPALAGLPEGQLDGGSY